MSKRLSRVTRIIVFCLIAAILVQSAITPSANACTYDGFVRKMKKAIAAGNILRVCELIVQFLNKRTGDALPPLTGMPTAADCATAGVPISPGPGDGRGRGGGEGTGGSAGGSADGRSFGFNSANSTDMFKYVVVPDPGNPPGFTVVGGSGTLTMPRDTMATAPFTINIAPGTPVGTMAFFDCRITDCGNGELIPEQFQRFKVTVLDGLAVTITQSDFNVDDGAIAQAKWTVTNLKPMARTVNYTFTMTNDPASEGKNNAGVAYPIPDFFSDPRMAMGGGSANLAASGSAGDSQEIIWDMEPGEYCDPGMLGCCGLELDGVFVGDQCFVNTADTGARCCMPGSLFLVRGTSAGGMITVTLGAQVVNVGLGAGLNRLQVVDLIAGAINAEWHVTDGYNFSGIPLFEELGIMHKGGVAASITSTDPGTRVVRLNAFPALQTFDVMPVAANRFRLDLDNHPQTIDIVLQALTLTAPNPMQTISTAPESPWDVSRFVTLNGAGVPILNPGNVYGATAVFNLSTNSVPIQFAGPIVVDSSPLNPIDQAFNVKIPVMVGPGPQVVADLWLHLRAYGANGANRFPVQMQPLSIMANPTMPGQFQVQYQAQVNNVLTAIEHEILTYGGATVVPAFCPTSMGDVNADLMVNSMDIKRFIQCSLSSESASTCPCGDVNSDGFVTVLDTPGFVNLLLN